MMSRAISGRKSAPTLLAYRSCANHAPAHLGKLQAARRRARLTGLATSPTEESRHAETHRRRHRRCNARRAARRAQDLRIRLAEDPDVLDPLRAHLRQAHSLREPVDKLVDIDKDLKIVRLASSWEWSKDQKSLTMKSARADVP
jgi:hypothetical protein